MSIKRLGTGKKDFEHMVNIYQALVDGKTIEQRKVGTPYSQWHPVSVFDYEMPRSDDGYAYRIRKEPKVVYLVGVCIYHDRVNAMEDSSRCGKPVVKFVEEME